jgi:hypothetical protein
MRSDKFDINVAQFIYLRRKTISPNVPTSRRRAFAHRNEADESEAGTPLQATTCCAMGRKSRILLLSRLTSFWRQRESRLPS